MSGSLRCIVIVAAACGLLAGADAPPKVPTGDVRLASGRVVDYAVHFDRNSLRSSVRAGDDLIALTSSGALLRFEFPSFKLLAERVAAEEVTCLGRGEGDAILAGVGDGRIGRVDPATLAVTEVARAPSAPQWVGWCRAIGDRPAGLVVVTEEVRTVGLAKMPPNRTYSVVHDLVTGKTMPLEYAASAFLLDRSGRLWLGADRGEWGGRATRVDLAKGVAADVKPAPPGDPKRPASWGGVYGFVELRDGQVWAHGGLSHMGVHQSFITRVDGDSARQLFSSLSDEEAEKPARPLLPVTHMIEEDGGLLVLSYSNLYRVDRGLSAWKFAGSLEIKYRWGRPDAVGAYPSIGAIHPPRKAGEPYLFATAGDGYVTLEGEKTVTHALRGQLGAAYVTDVLDTSEGLFFEEGRDEPPLWSLDGGGWKPVSLSPPFEPDPDGDVVINEAEQKAWYRTRLLVGPEKTIYAVSETNASAGTRVTSRRVGGKWERLGRETSRLVAPASFLTPDGTLWNAFYGDIWRFDGGRWAMMREQKVGTNDFGRLAVVGGGGPPWLLLDHFEGSLWRLTDDRKRDILGIARVEIDEDDRDLRITDAIAGEPGKILVATAVGLRIYDLAAATLSKTGLPEPPAPATRLARDGRGRLWLGGPKGLAMIDPVGKTIDRFDRVPWLGAGEVVGVAADPKHEDGVVTMLGGRGVVFLRVR